MVWKQAPRDGAISIAIDRAKPGIGRADEIEQVGVEATSHESRIAVLHG